MRAQLRSSCPRHAGQRLYTQTAAYTTEQFISDLAEATRAGDLVAAESARAKAKAASIGFNSNLGRKFPDGVTYQNDIRDAW